MVGTASAHARRPISRSSSCSAQRCSYSCSYSCSCSCSKGHNPRDVHPCPTVVRTRQQLPAQMELRPPRQIQSIPIHLCFSVSIRGSKIASPRHDGRITDVKRVQTPIRFGQSVFTPVLKAARSHMPSRCDSETPFCRITSDWHPRLSHAVASRLYNSHIALRLNCEAMPCNGLGRQFEEVIRRIGRSCKATAGAANQRSQQFGSPFRAPAFSQSTC